MKNDNLKSPGNRDNIRPVGTNTKKTKKIKEERFIAIGNRGKFFVVQTIPGMEEKDIIMELERTMQMIEDFYELASDQKNILTIKL